MVVAEGGDVAAEPVLSERLERWVELLEGDGVEVLDHADEVGAATQLGVLLQRRAQAVHDPKVGGHALADVGALQLDDRLAPVGEHAGMHLADRRRRQRRLLEVAEDLGGGAAEVLADHLAGGLAVEGRDLVEAAERGVRERRREDARGRGDELAQLHERGAEHLEGVDRALRRDRHPRALAGAGDPAHERTGDADGEGQVDDDHPSELGHPEALQRWGLDLERGRRRPVRKRSPEVRHHAGGTEVGCWSRHGGVGRMVRGFVTVPFWTLAARSARSRPRGRVREQRSRWWTPGVVVVDAGAVVDVVDVDDVDDVDDVLVVEPDAPVVVVVSGGCSAGGSTVGGASVTSRSAASSRAAGPKSDLMSASSWRSRR